MIYMGSKNRISKYIAPIIQSYIDKNGVTNYLEPFVGGGNMIDKIKCKNKYGSDIDNILIALFKHLQNGGKLIPEEKVTYELYDKARKDYRDNNYSNFTEWELGCIGWLSSWGGKGFKGGFARSKNGRFRYREACTNILKQMPNLMDVHFSCCDYKDWDKLFDDGKLVNYVIYCDIPYENTTQYGFNTNFNYEEFWNIMRKWSIKNIVLISEFNAPSDFKCIWSKEVINQINLSNKENRDSEKITNMERLFIYNKKD